MTAPMTPTAAPLTTDDLTTIIDNLVHTNEGNLVSVAFWKNALTNILAIFVTVIAFWHPGFTLPSHVQGLITAVIPSVAVLAAAISNSVFVHNAHQTRQAQIYAGVEVRRLALEREKMVLAQPSVTSVVPNTIPSDSGQPVTPTTP